MKNSKVIYFILVLLIAAVLFIVSRQTSVIKQPQYVSEDAVSQDSIEGCYVATLAKDVYSLGILSKENDKVSGTLMFDNFEKDSSSGTFEGTYRDGILFGNYSFQSEGMNSIMEVIFKKTENGFQRGFGPVDAEGTAFTDISQITYDNQYEFVKTNTPCPEPWNYPLQ